jgi:hypothetical protein
VFVYLYLLAKGEQICSLPANLITGSELRRFPFWFWLDLALPALLFLIILLFGGIFVFLFDFG